MRWNSAVARFALLTALLAAPASAESVPYSCVILPGADIADIVVTNSLASDASCIVTCAKPVPAGKEVEMCRLTSGGDKMVKLLEGQAECTR
jgi:hypothetical protein